MFVTVGSAEFRVQFVHSAHDQSLRFVLASPGGLRQIVDNLAASLRRRVTMAEIARVDRIPVGLDNNVRPTFVPLAQGFAVCHYTDQFNKAAGRERAFLRALQVLDVSRDTKYALSVAIVGVAPAILTAKYNTRGI